MPTCTVYFRGRDRQPLGAHVTTGATLFEACRNALDWFQDEHWLGPRPDPETILEVDVVGRPGARWYVRAGRVPERKPPAQSALFERAPDALDPH